MDVVPRIGRSERRDLLQMSRKSGDLPTALRFLIVARLGLRRTSHEVAGELEVARSTGCARRVGTPSKALQGYTTSGAATVRILTPPGHRFRMESATYSERSRPLIPERSAGCP